MQAPVNDSELTTTFRPIGYQAGSCGYCRDKSTRQRTPGTNACFYAECPKLSVEHYQNLVDRGWRRSGTLLYKPDVRRQCCKHYTIRLPLASFRPSKDQRQALNRWNRFILGDNYINKAARIRPVSKDDKAARRNTFDLCEAVHKGEYHNLDASLGPQHQFEITLEPSSFTEEKYALYANYQKVVHQELPKDISAKGFQRFLCKSPLQQKCRTVNGKEQKLGSYHQCYRLDGRLIAMGILDLLPHCVSAVYFVYHEDFESWSFGKLSALREAALAFEQGYEYYYMGYYIHSCAKMRYKGDYKPQFVLDPISLEWNELNNDIKSMLDQNLLASQSEMKAKSLARESDNREHVAAQGNSFRNCGLSEIIAPYYSGQISIFDIEMAGVMTLEQLIDEIDIDEIRITTPWWPGIRLVAKDIREWSDKRDNNHRSPMARILALAACVGPKVASEMIVELQ